MDVNLAGQMIEVNKVLSKPIEFYVLYVYERVLEAIKFEKQPGLAQRLIARSSEVIEQTAWEDIEQIENDFDHILVQEDEELDFAYDIDVYIYKSYRLCGKVLCGRSLNSKEIKELQGNFFIKNPSYSFLLEYEKQYQDFFEKLRVVDDFKLSVLYYFHNKTSF